MRNILFRAKRLDNGEWVEGYLCKTVKHLETCHQNVVVDCIEVYDGGSYLNIVFRNVDSTTVGQYTGLTDKNGKKIFEGDICCVCLDPEICTAYIEYDERTASFNLRYNEEQCNTFLDMRLAENRVGDGVWVEVIGNIHDNPELLEVDE